MFCITVYVNKIEFMFTIDGIIMPVHRYANVSCERLERAISLVRGLYTMTREMLVTIHTNIPQTEPDEDALTRLVHRLPEKDIATFAEQGWFLFGGANALLLYDRREPDAYQIPQIDQTRDGQVPAYILTFWHLVIARQRKIAAEAEARRRKVKTTPDNSTAGYVYLIQSATGTYKIGRAKNVADRARTFGVKLPFEVELLHTIECANYREAEKELHNRFAVKRVNGSEFFALTDEDVQYIRSIERM